jgi:predicted RNA methylase
MTEAVDNPFFARVWSKMSTREPESIRRLRRENLAGLSGRVLEVGAGTGTNFAFYPATVTEVVAIEPERRLAVTARQAAGQATVPVTVSTDTVEKYQTGEPFEHVASEGMRAPLQKAADAYLWPRLLGNCHTHRDTERSIVDAGFQVQEARHEWVLPSWVPLPVSKTAIGRATRPDD